jgi:hypothetical protein
LTNFHKICIVQSPIYNRQSSINWGGGADISLLPGKRLWVRRKLPENTGASKKTQNLALTQNKNGEINKTVCVKLLLNQNIRAVPKNHSGKGVADALSILLNEIPKEAKSRPRTEGRT